MAHLSTHVLDTAAGKPASGLKVDLYRWDGPERVHCITVYTNSTGRTDQPLLSGDRIPVGRYELIFAAGNYLRGCGVLLPDPPFLDEVVVRFGIANGAGKYHVPLLLSPYGYSTYKGA
jgi:5-hydroxyisourate hydrolase